MRYLQVDVQNAVSHPKAAKFPEIQSGDQVLFVADPNMKSRIVNDTKKTRGGILLKRGPVNYAAVYYQANKSVLR
jgi:hypothetical protein